MAIHTLLYFPLPSRMMGELMRSFIMDHFKNSCELLEDLSEAGYKEFTIFFIYDWSDIANGGKNTREHFFSNNHQAGPNIFYIVLNMLNGHEDQLLHFPHVQKIRGLFYINDKIETLKKGLSVVLNGDVWVPRKILMKWMNGPNKMKAYKHHDVLSIRELSVLKLVAVGLSNKEISQSLFISPNTVKAHLYNIYKKIDVSNRLQAAIWASDFLGEDRADEVENSPIN